MKNIKLLKYPLWFNIIFNTLTILAPISLIIVEGMKAPVGIAGTTFKITFMSICTGIIVWIILTKTLLKTHKTKLISKQTALEHDYSIEVGNPEKIKYIWHRNEIRLALFEVVSILLYGGLIATVLIGVANKLMQIKGIVLIVVGLYVIAYTLKFVLLLLGMGYDHDTE